MLPFTLSRALRQVVLPSPVIRIGAGLALIHVRRSRNVLTPRIIHRVLSGDAKKRSAHSITPRRYYSGASVTAGDRGGGCTVEVVDGGREVHVVWPGEEGQQSTYHAIWLKHHCQCPLCWNKTTAQYLTWEQDPEPQGVMVMEAKVKETGDLELVWSFASEGEQHRGSIPLKWLQENCYSHEALKRRREAATPTLATSLPVMNYTEIKQNEEKLWKCLKAINVYGLCLLTDVPTKPRSVIEVANLAGGLLSTHYGDVFDVVAEDTPTNLAYTDMHLPFHTDLTFYESPPGLQLLHCLRNDATVEGGESVLLDTWAVAEQFRKEHPKYFSTLATARITCQRIHSDRADPVMIRRTRPHFVLDKDGNLAALYWNRSLEGSLLIPPEQTEDYYEAKHCFKAFMNSSTLKLTHRLQPGETLVFNNRRMQHSRSQFVQHGGRRHLQGAYVGIDNFMSKVNVLASKHEPQFCPKNSFGMDTM